MALIDIGGGFIDPEYVAALLPNTEGTTTVVFNSGAHFQVSLHHGMTLADLAQAFNMANGYSESADDVEPGDEWKHA